MEREGQKDLKKYKMDQRIKRDRKKIQPGAWIFVLCLL
jgi:hypothetical protein